MKAPSEKHLEQWLLANADVLGYDEDNEFEPYHYRPLASQVSLPTGYLDILASSLDYLCVIELKKHEVGFSSLAQVLRYKRDIERIWEGAIAGMPLVGDGVDCNFWLEPKVQGILIGYDYTGGDDFLIAADAANVLIASYKFNDGQYQITWHDAPTKKRSSYLQYGNSEIGTHIRNWWIKFCWENGRLKGSDFAKEYKTMTLSELVEACALVEGRK